VPATDEILVKKVQQGDLAAFSILIERYQERLYSMALRILGSPEDAKDVTQEIFIRAYRALHKFRGEAAFSTWLYRLATNLCLDMVRARKREGGRSVSFEGTESLPEKVADSALGPEELTIERDTRQRVRRAIAELPENYRVVLVLHHYQGLSYREIARVLGVPINTVATYIARAKQKLRDTLLGGEKNALPKGEGKPGKIHGGRMFAP
jgi:RNA polymerase sigma-70 factor (ECF subfamily)